MTTGYYCAIFPFCGGGKKKDDKKTKAFYDWATTGIPVIMHDCLQIWNFSSRVQLYISLVSYRREIPYLRAPMYYSLFKTFRDGLAKVDYKHYESFLSQTGIDQLILRKPQLPIQAIKGL